MLERLLSPIYATQQQLDHEAHHDLHEYAAQAHEHVQNLAKTHGVTIQYGTRTGGYETLQPSLSQEKASEQLVSA
jgi:hypothetical protein